MNNFLAQLKSQPIVNDQYFFYQDYLLRKRHYHQQVISKMPIPFDNQLYDEEMDCCQDYGLLYKNYYLDSVLLQDCDEVKAYLTRNVFLRRSILRDLFRIDQAINHYGLRLLILSGYRHPQLQQTILQTVSQQKGAELANRLFADPQVYAPHATGAAFDLELWDDKKKITLPTKMPGIIDRFSLEEKKELTLAEEEVRDNRRLLHNLLTTNWLLPSEQGFIGHPFEYWHFGRHERLAAFFANNGHPVYYDVLY